MAIRNVVLSEQSGGEELTGGKRVRTYQQVYTVTSDTKKESIRTILTDARVPLLASGFYDDPGALCVKRDPKQIKETLNEWKVTLDFTSAPSIRDPDQAKENPLERPAVVDRKPQQRQRIIERDVNGNLIQNTARERPDPPPEREEHAPAFTIARNLGSWPAALEIAFTDSINLNALMYPVKGIVYPAYCVKYNGLSGHEAWENGFRFWECSADFEVDWEGWNKRFVNAGYNERFYDSGVYYLWPVTGANGERPSSPVLLDDEGRADPYRTSPILLDYPKYRAIDQAALFALLLS